MKETISLTVKVAPEIHDKLKILSVVQKRTMSEIISTFVEKQPFVVPDYMNAGAKRKTVRTGTQKAVSVDETAIKEKALALKADGLSLQKIAEALEDAGLPTKKGGPWNRGKVGSLMRKWEKQESQASQDTSESTQAMNP